VAEALIDRAVLRRTIEMLDPQVKGVGVEDIVINNDREVRTAAHEVMSWLGWL